MYTLLVQNDNSVIATVKTAIMQRSKLVDQLQILVPKYYNNIDLTDAAVKLEYVTPSSTYHFQMLTLHNAEYKGDYLQYIVEGDTDITAESGDVEFHLVFLMLNQADGKEITQQVRETQNFKIYITPSSAWSLQFPDEFLEPLNQTILAQLAAARQTEALAQELYDHSTKDIVIDKVANRIKLLARSGQIGEGVDINTLAQDIADIILSPDPDGTGDGITYLDEIPDHAANLDKLLEQ